MAGENAMRSSTIDTYLYYNSGTAETPVYEKLVDIKDFPDLGGEPDTIETTTLSDKAQTFLLGVKSMSSMTFTANYVSDDYDKVSALADYTIRDFEIRFGTNAEYGKFQWKGQISIWVTGGGVNAVRDMTISISPSTEVIKVTDSN